MIQFGLPDGFLWGAACSSFQMEGGADAEGRGPSVWDEFPKRFPERFYQGATPAVAADFYHRYRDDVSMMRDLGLKSFRLSVSWSRVMPEGRGRVNEPGIDFYNRVFDALLANGIEPFVDLYHWDLPWALAVEGGFNNPRIVDHFEAYARLCFGRFGDRVKYWSTMNEPGAINYFNPFDPATLDRTKFRRWQMHVLLMHFAAVRAYRDRRLPGKIGAVIAHVPMYPRSLADSDRRAAALRQDEVTNVWLDPMLKGTYPELLAGHPDVGPFLPPNLRDRISNAFAPMDFLGMNYYTPAVVGHKASMFLEADNAKPFAAETDVGFVVYPQGLFDSLRYVRERYGDVEVYITENGFGTNRETRPADDPADRNRVEFLREHLREVVRCLEAGFKVKGYFYWSLFDTYEAMSGYRLCFGLLHVDFKTLRRNPRWSWFYYRDCIASNSVVPDIPEQATLTPGGP